MEASIPKGKSPEEFALELCDRIKKIHLEGGFDTMTALLMTEGAYYYAVELGVVHLHKVIEAAAEGYQPGGIEFPNKKAAASAAMREADELAKILGTSRAVIRENWTRRAARPDGPPWSNK